MMFSFFSKPIDLEAAILKIAYFYDFEIEYTKKLVSLFLENDHIINISYDGNINSFPKNILIKEYDSVYSEREYNPDMFLYSQVDIDTIRMKKAPLGVTFMINNKCLTNCIYCYADRSTHCAQMSFENLKHIVADARQLNVEEFNLDGGEFFLYPHWKKLLKLLADYKYKPAIISTKYPITESDIEFIKPYGIGLQVSLDSLNQSTLDLIVGHIENYASRIKDSLIKIDSAMPFQIATVLTRFNGTISELEKIYQFILRCKNIKRWEVRVAFKSLYSKNNFEDILVNKETIKELEKWVMKVRKDSPFDIQWSPGRETDFFKSDVGSSGFRGGRCTANSTHCFILPDGKVTICEQLYWKRAFIIGDLTINSLAEIWNSDRALSLAHMKQTEYSIKSACRHCDIFKQCKKYMNCCIPNILKVYGDENWDYPDPRCSKAPRNINQKIYV